MVNQLKECADMLVRCQLPVKENKPKGIHPKFSSTERGCCCSSLFSHLLAALMVSFLKDSVYGIQISVIYEDHVVS